METARGQRGILFPQNIAVRQRRLDSLIAAIRYQRMIQVEQLQSWHASQQFGPWIADVGTVERKLFESRQRNDRFDAFIGDLCILEPQGAERLDSGDLRQAAVGSTGARQ